MEYPGGVPRYNPDGTLIGHFGDDAFYQDQLGAEQMPLLKKDHRANLPRKPMTSFQRVRKGIEAIIMKVAPTAAVTWFVFLAVSLVTTFLYHNLSFLVVLSVVVGCITSVVLSVSSFGAGSRARALALLVCCAAILTGFVCGYYNYCVNARDFYAYYERRMYDNVLPDELAAAHADASVMGFAEGTAPDVRRFGQYGSGSRAFCVAPVVRGLSQGYSSNTAGIQFWAVGRGCCSGSQFACGDVHDATAHSGLVLQNRTNAFTGIITNEMRYYMEAVGMATAKYGLASAPKPLLMYWAKHPLLARGIYLRKAWAFWLKAGIISLLVWIALAAIATAASTMAAASAAFSAASAVAARAAKAGGVIRRTGKMPV